MYSIIDIELSVNLAGVISQPFGCVVKFCKFHFGIEKKLHLTIFISLIVKLNRRDNYVALKVIKSAQHYTETAADEIRLLEAIRKNESQHPYCEKIVRLLNHFTIRGVNGVHTCLVFEALGCSLYKLIVKNNFQGLPIKMVKSIIRQVRR